MSAKQTIKHLADASAALHKAKPGMVDGESLQALDAAIFTIEAIRVKHQMKRAKRR